MKFPRFVTRLLLKSLYDLHPDLLNREHVWRIWSDEETENPSGFDTFASDYSITTWVHTAVKKWQDAFAFLPLRVLENGKEVKHELSDLLAHPNPTRSASDVWRQWAADMALGGEQGLEMSFNKSGTRIVELWPHQPSAFSVIPDADRRIYFVPAGYKIERPGIAVYELPVEEFFHFKFYNPQNPWRGLSPMSAIRMSVSIEQLASAWSKMFFSNGARPDGILITPQGLTKTEREEVETKFQQKLGISGKSVGWHKVIALEKGIVDYKPITSTQKDIQWAETRRLSRNEIGGIFGVPDEVMGFGKDTYENFERALLFFWSETMFPLIAFRDDGLTFAFRRAGKLSSTQFVRTDLTEISVLMRLQNPRYQLALWLFQMGVPFNRVDEFLKLGVGGIGPAGDISLPYGTNQGFTPGGDLVASGDSATAVSSDQSAASAAKILRILEQRGVKVSNGVS